MPNDSRFDIVLASGERINLSKEVVCKYIAPGAAVSDQEYNYFFQLCKTYKVNPFTKEAYLIKYGSTPATIVVDYKVYQQIADRSGHFRGMRHGLVIRSSDGSITERNGDFYVKGSEQIVAGWAEVFRDDRDVPTKAYAQFDEFSSGKSKWVSSPAFMIVKVAKAHALREAFPTAFGSNVYTKDEMGDEAQQSAASKGGVANDLTADEPIQAEADEAIEAEVLEEGEKAL